MVVTSVLLAVTIHSAVTNSSNSQSPTALILPKQASPFDDYDFNDKNNTAEGSGGNINLDDYADDEEDDQLSKITATTIISSTSTTNDNY